MMKRNLSDMDSDCDDVFTDDYTKGNPNQSDDGYQLLNRKRRRGVIEKRRRDRINNCLSELRRLVPAAFEKQGSAKLEKAEILQMTVEHLKLLHAKGFDPFSLDPHKMFMDYHSIGFRECASEVARYLVAKEGLDLQDPLRLRLMSHLQCYSAQRDLAVKSTVTQSPWNTGSSQYFSHPIVTPSGPGVHTSSSMILDTPPGAQYSCSISRLAHHSASEDSMTSCLLPPHPGPHVPRVPSNAMNTMSPPTMEPSINPSSTFILSSPSQMPTSQYLGTQGLPSSGYGWSNTSPQPSSSIKPYRPWGAEVAY
ncbi:hairy/enhancer-of-split related with YRPW motif protein 1-like [Tachypleus tridentatus]|uniref:hairy/enhancer-of-split related with YRPW motif protein 1-like n=1 Tax=Tachypleus tridentatus TaxID=6853 RepID=UPI003FD3D45D